MEKAAQALGIARADQDEVTLASQHCAARAREQGFFDDLIIAHAGVRQNGKR
jgi:acetyl-CoA acetyltransferase